VTTIV